MSSRSSDRGSRDASRPASTARATTGSTGTSATTGAPTTSSTSARREGSARFADQHDLRWTQGRGHGAAQRQEARSCHQHRAARGAGNSQRRAVGIGAAVGDDGAVVGCQQCREHVAALGTRSPSPARQQLEPGRGHDLQSSERVGGHIGPRGQPPDDSGAVGFGHAQRGGRVAGEVDEKRVGRDGRAGAPVTRR